MLDACGMTGLPDPTVFHAFGQAVLLSHGDALCLSDTAYQRFRQQVRSEAWQMDFLSRPLPERRAMAREIREESQRRQQQPSAAWSDVDPTEALRWMREAGTPVLIHGHTHRPARHQLAPGFERCVLSDWDWDHADAPPRAEVLRWTRTGLTRLAP
jgi:UDP-2,3-diacylglucosamine hydrolase